MKEQYISPEIKLLCFAPAERLASSDVDFDDLLDEEAARKSVVGMSGDVDVGMDTPYRK